MFNNILVAYDGSSSSRAAVDRALELAKASNAEVTLLTVAPSVAPLVGLSGVSIEELDAELRQWAGRTAREGAATASNGLTVHTVTRSGHIGEEIVAQIEAGGYDLVVLGSRGRGRLTSELCGKTGCETTTFSSAGGLKVSRSVMYLPLCGGGVDCGVDCVGGRCGALGLKGDIPASERLKVPESPVVRSWWRSSSTARSSPMPKWWAIS